MRLRERWAEDAKEQAVYTWNNKVQAVILGGAAGDALGVPYEFRKRDSFLATAMTGYGTYQQPAGSWSDDTSLTLCLMENMAEDGSLFDLLDKFSAFYENAYWTPFGCSFDIGITTLDAIRNYKNGIPPQLCGGDSERSNGNGSLMRISPVLFATISDPDPGQLIAMVKSYSAVTHRHPRSILGCIIYIEFLTRIYLYDSFDTALDNTIEFCQTIIKDEELKKEFCHYERIFKKEISHLDRTEIFSDGYVVHTLEAALWSFATSDSYKDAVLKAVNLGEDTDTVGFVTGTIAGLKYGVNGIPEEWVQQLGRVQDIKELCRRVAENCYRK